MIILAGGEGDALPSGINILTVQAGGDAVAFKRILTHGITYNL
ncbi:MAG: hypothetical protein ACUVQ8_07865 [Nitrososphaeria archaeon]